MMEYYTAMKKEAILPYATIRMDPKHIMLNKISQRKTRTVWHHLYVELKKVKPVTKTKNKMVVTRGWGEGSEGKSDGV